MREQGKRDAARKALTDARKRHPDNDDLLALDVAFRVEAKQATEADRVLAAFLAKHSTHTEVALLRARLLAGDDLKKPEEAKKILVSLCEKAETSAPLIQLALLDLADGRYEAVATTIAKIRTRWKESASGDLLDAQLAMARNNPREAVAFFDEALPQGPVEQGRPLLEGAARREGRRPGRRGQDLRGDRPRQAGQGGRSGPLAGGRRRVGPGDAGPRKPGLRRRHRPVRDDRQERRDGAGVVASLGPLAAGPGARGQGGLAGPHGRDGIAAQEPRTSSRPRAHPGGEPLSPEQGPPVGPRAVEPRPGRRPVQFPSGRRGGLSPRRREASGRGGAAHPQGHR